jgi:hypothetical protein
MISGKSILFLDSKTKTTQTLKMTTHTISTLNNGVLRQSKSDCIISSGGHINYHISTKILTNFNKGTLLPCLLPFGFVVQENMFTADKYKVMTMTVFHMFHLD